MRSHFQLREGLSQGNAGFTRTRNTGTPVAARLPAGFLLMALLLSGTSTSCFFSKKPRPAQITVPPAPEPDTKPVQIPQPPNLPTQEQPHPPIAQQQPETPPPPAQPPPKRTRRARAQPAPAPPPTTPPAETAPQPDPPVTPRLGQMLSPEQQRDYTNAINSSVGRARQNVGYLRAHTLTEDQKAAVAQIESFLSQVEEARKYDLVAARSLAERADVLAGDLAKAVR